MKLNIMTPTGLFETEDVEKIVAEGKKGSFCILPRHIDYVATIVPGILSYSLPGNKEVFLAVDEGVLVKKGSEVMISVRSAVKGPELGGLKKAVVERFEELDEREKKARAILARLEADFAKRFLELK
ncbi:ATP synthase epsilon chain [uncultured Desulfobacterium sp.]|uniref:ATP synthase epsilon chain n=1 Tax=uncultured Desulfobacterium sp. TaxID=201089 RepID=A0A445MZQ5_9BACT|nr:ATP synthase epsilon chain [uncultured Desulfobacterium sp.]